MHSVKEYIMPKHVKYVSLNILQFNEKWFFFQYSMFAGEKIKIFYFLRLTGQKLPFFPSHKTPALGYLCFVNYKYFLLAVKILMALAVLVTDFHSNENVESSKMNTDPHQ